MPDEIEKYLLRNNFELEFDQNGKHKHYQHVSQLIGCHYHTDTYYLVFRKFASDNFECCNPPPVTIEEFDFMIGMIQRRK